MGSTREFVKNFGEDENFMRNMIKSLTLGLGLLTATAANAQLAYYVELGNSFSPRKVGNDIGTGIYASGTYKFSDTLKGSVEYSQDLTYMAKGESSLDQSHGYIRVPVTRSGLNWLGGDWKTSFTTRWTVPTNSAAQQAGGWGSILLRPAFSLEGKIWSVLLRPQVGFGLIDGAYQKYVVPGETPAGNTLVSWAFEFIPAYKISDKMSLTLSSSVSQAYKGGAPGKDGGFATAKLGYEIIADIPVTTGPVSYAVSVANETLFDKNFNIFNTQKSSYTFYVMASF
jgi:hypothetical protein